MTRTPSARTRRAFSPTPAPPPPRRRGSFARIPAPRPAIRPAPRSSPVEALEGRVLLATVPAGFTDTNDWASGLSNTATAMAFAPDGRLFVSQQPGQLRVITPPATPGGKAT